jgi:hypothetical protein
MSNKHWTADQGMLEYFILQDGGDQLNLRPKDMWGLEVLAKRAAEQGKTISIVVYDAASPLCGEIFKQCWEKCGKPLEVQNE